MTIYGDDFTDTAATALTSHTASGTNGGWSWTKVDGTGAAAINASNQLKTTANDSFYSTPSIGTADHYAQGTMPGPISFNGSLAIRTSSSANYIAMLYPASSGPWTLRKNVASTLTTLATDSSAAPSNTLGRLQAVGNTITWSRAGVALTAPASESFNNTVQTAGFVNRTAADPALDNFEAGPVSAGTTYNDTLSESVTLADSVDSSATFPNTLSESVTLADTVSGGLLLNSTLSESVTLADSYANAVTWGCTLTEALSLLDSVDPSGSVYGVTLSEAITLADSYAASGGSSSIWTPATPASGTWSATSQATGTWTPLGPASGTWTPQ